MATFTVFCQEAGGGGTIWISAVEARDVDDAEEVGRQMCADDWSYDASDVHVLGIAEGNVNILFWQDQGE